MKAIFITVRVGSSRLPNKSLLKIKGKHTIEYVIDAVKKSKQADKITLCTTWEKDADILCDIAKKNKIEWSRGSELNKFERWSEAASSFNIDFFVTADGDDLFYDAGLADLVFKQYEESKSNFINGRGLYVDLYGVKSKALKKVVDSIGDNSKELEPFQLERYMSGQDIKNVPNIYEKKKIRMTLDYQEDFDFFNTVINDLQDDFTYKDVLKYIKKNKDVVNINYHKEQDWKVNQQKLIKDRSLKYVVKILFQVLHPPMRLL